VDIIFEAILNKTLEAQLIGKIILDAKKDEL